MNILVLFLCSFFCSAYAAQATKTFDNPSDFPVGFPYAEAANEPEGLLGKRVGSVIVSSGRRVSKVYNGSGDGATKGQLSRSRSSSSDSGSSPTFYCFSCRQYKYEECTHRAVLEDGYLSDRSNDLSDSGLSDQVAQAAHTISCLTEEVTTLRRVNAHLMEKVIEGERRLYECTNSGVCNSNFALKEGSVQGKAQHLADLTRFILPQVETLQQGQRDITQKVLFLESSALSTKVALGGRLAAVEASLEEYEENAEQYRSLENRVVDSLNKTTELEWQINHLGVVVGLLQSQRGIGGKHKPGCIKQLQYCAFCELDQEDAAQ